MSELFVKIAIIASTAGFAPMLSLLPKGFSGTIPFLQQFFPSKNAKWYFRVNFFLIIIIGNPLAELI